MNLGLREGASLGEGEKESSRQFPLPALGRVGGKHCAWLRAHLMRERTERPGDGVSPPAHLCLWGVACCLPGWVGWLGSLCLVVSLSLSNLDRLKTALASDPQGALSLPPFPSQAGSLLLSAREGDT